MKRILLVAYNFPPLISPQSLRWLYLCRALSSGGYEVDVLTIRMPSAFSDMMEEIPSGTGTYRTFPGPFYALTFAHSTEGRQLREGTAGEPPQGVPGPPAPLVALHGFLARMLNAILVPDAYIEWLPFAMARGARLLREKRHDVIISSSEPRACHVVGCLLSRKSGLPWIADYGDPWIYPVPLHREPSLKVRLVARLEARLMRTVAAVTVAAEGTRMLYLRRFPFLGEDRIRVIPQGFDPALFARIGTKRSQKFRIVYCGSFYENLRDPMPFLRAVADIATADIEVVVAGRINRFADTLRETPYREKVVFRGFLPHKESLALQKGADLLLHIGNATDVQVPGKIYEYLGAGRPILSIAGAGRDVSADLVGVLQRGIVVRNEQADIRRALVELHTLWRNGALDARFSLGDLDQFTWRRRAEDLVDVLEGATKARHSGREAAGSPP